MTPDSEVVFWLDNRTEIAFANLRPEVEKTPNGRIALFALAKNGLHGVKVWVRCLAFIPDRRKVVRIF